MEVYCVTNIITNKKYVGQTSYKKEVRWRQHRYEKSGSSFLRNAIKKYGEENFTIETIKECSSQEELDKMEEFYIKEFNTLAPNGYNLTTGGVAPKHSEITKEKMSRTRKGKEPIWATNASHNLESNKLRAEALKGQKRTLNQKANIKNGKRLLMKPVIDQNGVIYESVADAAKKLDVNRGNLQMVLRGKRKSVGGFSFEFLDKE
jgi:group I intron endonuclease